MRRVVKQHIKYQRQAYWLAADAQFEIAVMVSVDDLNRETGA
jgi:hypothetical protein